MRHRTMIVGAGAVLAALASSAQCSVFNFDFALEAAQENHVVNGTPGTGFAMVTYDDVTNELSWTITYADMTSAVNAAHFHGPAPIGMDAPPQVNIGMISGLASPMTGMATLDATQETELLSGMWYVNVHTDLNSTGEIRGQVVPTPGALGLLLLGGIVALRRHR